MEEISNTWDDDMENDDEIESETHAKLDLVITDDSDEDEPVQKKSKKLVIDSDSDEQGLVEDEICTSSMHDGLHFMITHQSEVGETEGKGRCNFCVTLKQVTGVEVARNVAAISVTERLMLRSKQI